MNRAWRLSATTFALSAAFGAAVQAQRPDSMATISGVVYDSIARAPLADATVQLVSVGGASKITRGATTDSSGRFTLPSIPSGEYMIGFAHATLDSLGIEPSAYRVSARPGASTTVTLAVPSPTHLHDVICGARPKTDSSGVIIGHLYDADTRIGIPTAPVAVRWLELTISSTGITSSFTGRGATTADNGWFAICNVPLLTRVALRATNGSDSTAEVALEIPGSRLLRRDLYLGASQVAVLPSPDTAAIPDSLRLPPTYVHHGSAQLSGVVERAGSNAPLRGARVTIAGSGIVATTDDRGRFALASLPGGTQMLETRAVGFLPDRRVVDLLGATSPSVEITLPTMKSVLDTVRVTANRVYSADVHGFERRRKNGFGEFFGAEDVERSRPIATSSLLSTVPSVRVAYGRDEPIRMRRNDQYCVPLVIIDGIRLESASASDIDDWVSPESIDGLEVYTHGSQVPPQFSSMRDCGAIIIWTRRPTKEP